MKTRLITSVLVLALLMAACGGGEADDGLATLETTGTTRPTGSGDAVLDAEESILALTECMRIEGVDIPDPEFDDQGNLRLVSLTGLGEAIELIDPDELAAAAEACREHLVGVAQLFQNIDRTAIEDRLFDFAACMREQGFDMPDPDFSISVDGPGQGGPGHSVGEIDMEDPAFQEASEACMWVFGDTVGTGGFGPSAPEGGD